MIKIKPIKTKADHKAAVAEIEKIWGAVPDTQEGDRLDVLMILANEYEEKHFPIDPPDPIEAIKFRMEQEGLDRKDIGKFIGRSSRVSEILNRDRPLTINMIRKLHEGLKISPEVLIKEYALKKTA